MSDGVHPHTASYLDKIFFWHAAVIEQVCVRVCVQACVRNTQTLMSDYWFLVILLLPSILHGGTTLLLHVFVHSWTTRATMPLLIIAFHLSGDTETHTDSCVNFSGTQQCSQICAFWIWLHHVILAVRLFETEFVCAVLSREREKGVEL